MARSLPVVVTRSGGLAETVQDGETGFIVEKDSLALKRAVEALIADVGLRHRMGQAGRTRAEERHHPQTCMGALRKRALALSGR